MMRILPWIGAWLATSLALALLVAGFTDQNPVLALAYGWFGVIGHGGYVAVAALGRRRRAAEFDEQLAEHFLSTPREVVATGQDVAILDDGLARLHADIRADETRRYRTEQDYDDRP